jgi:glutamyl-tRNA reductase
LESEISSKIVLSKLEKTLKSLLNEKIYPLINSFNEKTKEVHEDILSKLSETSSKCEDRLKEAIELLSSKISSSADDVASEYYFIQ